VPSAGCTLSTSTSAGVRNVSDVFVSYSRQDIAFARILHDALKARNLDTWIDWQDIPPTADWLDEVYQAIESANTFVFLVSDTSINSEICHLEIAHAVRNHKRLVPIVLHDIDPKALPPAVASRNWIFFREQDDFQQAFRKLLQAVETDLAWTRLHTRLLVRATEWDKKKRDNSFVLRGSDLRDGEEWLARATAHGEPRPTSLQVEYVLASREAATRRQRMIVGTVTLALVIAIVLALVAWGQRNEARDQQGKAEQQRRVAVSRQLAAQSQALLELEPSLLQTSVLLAVEAMQRHPALEADQALRRGLALLPRQTAQMVHDHSVTAISFSPDGKKLATASADHSARLWEVPSGREVARMAHGGAVRAATFSPEGRYLATGSDDGTIRLWEVPSGREMATITKLAGMEASSFSPDGKYLTSANNDGVAIVWEVPSGREVARVEHGKDEVVAAAFSPDGQYLVTRGSNRARVWEVASGREMSLTDDPALSAISFSPDGKYFTTQTGDGTLRVWEVSSGREVARIVNGSERPTVSVDFSPDGKHFTTEPGDGTLRVWETSTGQEVTRIALGPFAQIEFSPDGKLLATAFIEDRVTVQLWEVATGLEVALISPDGYLLDLSFSPDGRYLGIVSSGFSVRILEAVSGREVARMGGTQDVEALSFSPDGHYVAIWSSYGTVLLWDMASGRDVTQMAHDCACGVSAVSFSPDGKYLATGSLETVRIWQLGDGREISRLTVNDEAITCSSFSPSGKYVATASNHGTVWIWEVSASGLNSPEAST